MWAGTSTFDVAQQRIIVRSSDRIFHDALRATLRRYLTDGDDDGCCTYSVVQEAATRTLYRGTTLVIRTRQGSRLLTTLVGQLSAHAVVPSSEHLHVYGLAFLKGDKAVVVPWDVVCQVATLRSRTEAVGWRLLDGPLLIDRKTAELVVQENTLKLDWTPFETAPPLPAAGRYSIVDWAFHAREGTTSPAAANLSMLQIVANRRMMRSQDLLDGVARVLRHAAISELPRAAARDLADPLLALLRHADRSPSR